MESMNNLKLLGIEVKSDLRRPPLCARCRNHGVEVLLKGHKRHCLYRYCQCEQCKMTVLRQNVVAHQIKQQRDKSKCHPKNANQLLSQSSSDTSSQSLENEESEEDQNTDDKIYDIVNELLTNDFDALHCSIETLSFMYAIASHSEMDVKTMSKLLEEGKSYARVNTTKHLSNLLIKETSDVDIFNLCNFLPSIDSNIPPAHQNTQKFKRIELNVNDVKSLEAITPSHSSKPYELQGFSL
ncbi:unnamed protein product [Diamesa serratosioi]